MSTLKSVSAAALAMSIVAAVNASALAVDTVTIVPTVGVVTNTSTSATLSAPPTDLVGNTLYVYTSGVAATYTINYTAVASLASGEQFGSVLFGLKPTSGLTLGTYTANNASGAWLNVPNGASNTLVNGSFGNTPSSLNQIAASVGKGPYASGSPQANVGITPGAASAVGAATISWDGVTPGQVLKFQDQTGVTGQLQFAAEDSTSGVIGATQTSADALTVQFVTALPGDANFDGNVTGADVGILSHNFGAGPGAPGGASIGDFNGDGSVTGADVGILSHNFGASWTNSLPAPLVQLADLPAIAASPAPEPASLGLLALGGMALIARRRKA